MKVINLRLERFRDRVEFSGNPSKYDASVTLRKVQVEDEGLYNCYIMNPPDRHRGHGKIYLQVLMEGEGWRVGAGCWVLWGPRPSPPAGSHCRSGLLEEPMPPGAGQWLVPGGAELVTFPPILGGLVTRPAESF